MSVIGDLLGYENLEVVSPYPIQELLELQIIRRLNCHTMLNFTAVLSETNQDRPARDAKATDRITVNRKNGPSADEPLFKGVPVNIGVKTVRGIYYLEAEAVSDTIAFDVKLRQRSFQNKKMKYSDLFSEIAGVYSGGSINDQVSNGETLPCLVVQKDETDWQLLQRLASRFHTFLIPYDLAGEPKLWFGLPEDDGQKVELPGDLPYQVGKDLARFGDLSQNYLPSVTDTDFTYFLVTTGQSYPLGARVTFRGVKLVVAQSVARLTNGSLLYEYLLYPSAGLRQKPLFNRKITGASLTGKVIDIEKDRVRVHLAIDSRQDKDTAWWFPYTSFYTAEGNSGFYCMPQLGDTLQVYFPTCKEEEAVATMSLRTEKQSSQKTQDPGVRYLGTNQGKELMMTGNELSLTAKDQKEGQILIKLTDERGIEIRSDNEIELTATKKLILDSGQKVSIKAKDEVQLLCGSSSIDMDGITHLKGATVRIEPQS